MVLIDTLLVVVSLILIFDYNEGQFQVKFTDEKRLHVSKELTSTELEDLVNLSDQTYFHRILNNTLVPRVVGTESHEKVKEMIGSELRALSWDVEYDSFIRRTPNMGKLQFTNVISRLDPTAPRYLVLACHYDSKYFKDIEFVGAIDSAVPCAMLLHLAKVLTPYLPIADSRVSLMFVFFDGEEAFEDWSDTDSLYGARNLAEKWSSTLYATREENLTYLHRMDLLVLLDLIGTRDTVFYSFFSDTARWHKVLADIESRMRANSLLLSNQTRHFDERSSSGYIEDDHIPFLIRGVPVLHLIPSRFPRIWHTQADNYSALHFPTIESISRVLTVFVYSYLNGNTAQI